MSAYEKFKMVFCNSIGLILSFKHKTSWILASSIIVFNSFSVICLENLGFGELNVVFKQYLCYTKNIEIK